MSFQIPLTIQEAFRGIESRQYVLPSIQREFVWRPDQVLNLLDSLPLGNSVGSFLFWRVEPATSQTFRFYDFVREYHERDVGENYVSWGIGRSNTEPYRLSHSRCRS